MKRLFVLLMSVSLVACLYAVPSKKYKLVVKTTDREYSYALYNQPEISFTSTDIVITIDQENVRFAKSDIVEFLFDYNQYKVTFWDWDGDTLQSSMVHYGDYPYYGGITPTRESDAQYTYTFTGWSPELSMVTGTASYYAQYEETLNQYEVTFYDWNGEVLQSTIVNYGELPSYTGITPTRESNAQYTYTFTGWDSELNVVTGAQSYTAQYEATLNQYEVTFLNWDGSVLQSTMVNYGELPVYTGATPTRESNAQYTYTFTGWGDMSIVTGNQSYTAQYEATLNQYEVIFYNWNGEVLQSTMVNYGEMPSYTGITPTHESDAQYTYTFTGWSPELSVVTGAQSYTAQYDATINQYEVTFLNWDGSVLQSTMVDYGEMPSYTGITPTRESDAQYTYTFTGWGDMSVVTGAQSYTAQYESTLNQYEINFYDWDGSVLYLGWDYYGDYPFYGGATPTRESNAQYTYTFTGWSPQLDWVTGTASYYAQYEATLNQYEVTFYDWNGEVLQSTMVNYGELPSYTGITPTRESNAQYTYTFTSWSPELSVVTGVQSYTAQYEATLNQYEVTFYDWNGELLYSSWVNYGDYPYYGGNIPWREPDAQYTYTFTGWSPELSVVTGAQSYTAQYEATLNQYEVIFYNWDGNVLQSTMVNYGELPSYTGVTPTRESDAQYTYTFTGWSPELSIVTSNQSYTAQYDSTLNQYEVTFLNWDGNVLQSTMVNYGELPSYTGITPTRESDAQYTYTFTGWSPELSVVTGAQSYTAQYEATLNQYEVTFYNWDGSVLQSTMVNYGEMPVYEAATPTKPEDEHYVYTFFGWEPEITIVISEAEYTAQYEETEKTISSVDNAIIDQEKPHKVFIDGKLFIIHGEHIYSGQGHQIK